MRQLEVGRAPGRAPPQADSGVDAGLAQRHAGRARRGTVLGEALEAVLEKRVKAPALVVELEPDARAVQVEALAFVEVEELLVVVLDRAAVRCALEADGVADAEAARRQRVGQRIAGRARRRAEKTGYKRKSSSGPFGTICVGLMCFMLR